LAARDRLHCHLAGIGSWGEFGQGLDGAVGEAGQHIKQILANRNIQFAATLDDAEDSGNLWSRLFAAYMQPILPANSDSPDILPMSVRN
jgi:hypothetical protein